MRGYGREDYSRDTQQTAHGAMAHNAPLLPTATLEHHINATSSSRPHHRAAGHRDAMGRVTPLLMIPREHPPGNNTPTSGTAGAPPPSPPLHRPFVAKSLPVSLIVAGSALLALPKPYPSSARFFYRSTSFTTGVVYLLI